MNLQRKAFLVGVSGIVAAVMVGSIAGPASATIQESAPQSGSADTSETLELSPEVQAQADEYALYESSLQQSLTGPDGARVFDFDLASSLGVPVEVATDYAQGISLAGGTVTGSYSAPDAVSSGQVSKDSALRSVASCVGETRGWVDGFGAHARFNSCDTDTLVAALSNGASYTAVAAVLAGFGGGVYAAGGTALVAAIIQLSGTSIAACAVNGTGVEVAAAGFICWAQ